MHREIFINMYAIYQVPGLAQKSPVMGYCYYNGGEDTGGLPLLNGLRYAKRSLMSGVVVIPKEGWTGKFFCEFFFLNFFVWQRLRTLGTFLHNAAHLYKGMCWDIIQVSMALDGRYKYSSRVCLDLIAFSLSNLQMGQLGLSIIKAILCWATFKLIA